MPHVGGTAMIDALGGAKEPVKYVIDVQIERDGKGIKKLRVTLGPRFVPLILGTITAVRGTEWAVHLRPFLSLFH
jgi:hypothetical protein